ncbi:MAG: hypothetical protein M0T76_02095 [Desulfobacteraceae bacterium]|nr:hypothetical protein [Desulfobacteraceae bacterium]
MPAKKPNTPTPVFLTTLDLETFAKSLSKEANIESVSTALSAFQAQLDYLAAKLPPPDDGWTTSDDFPPDGGLVTHHREITELRDMLLRIRIRLERGKAIDETIIDSLCRGIYKLQAELQGLEVNRTKERQSKRSAGKPRITSAWQPIAKRLFKQSEVKKPEELWELLFSELENSRNENEENRLGYDLEGVKTEGSKRKGTLRYIFDVVQDTRPAVKVKLKFKTFENFISSLANPKKIPPRK